ncbi:hypothetical protein [Streptomyces niveus]|uniref:hypothetical protein n=1 Tax=Streptomyces niveus TaxID=193462 RepID=UPI00343BABAB
MAEYDFPQDLRDAQLRLHQVTAAYHQLCRTLPWSVEPAPGWAAGEKQPYTDDKSAKPDSPGYTDHQKSEVARLRAALLELFRHGLHAPVLVHARAGHGRGGTDGPQADRRGVGR